MLPRGNELGAKYSDENWFLTLTPLILILTHQQQAAFENIVGKKEIARHEQFLLFPQCFLLNQIIITPFVHVFVIISFLLLNGKSPKLAYEVQG